MAKSKSTQSKANWEKEGERKDAAKERKQIIRILKAQWKVLLSNRELLPYVLNESPSESTAEIIRLFMNGEVQ